MSGPEHFDEAQRLLDMDGCEYGCPHSGCPHEMRLIARAQVHATLALTAATVLPRLADGKLAGGDDEDWQAAMSP